jgi:phage/plasmid-like protein (TIGR03299 family)
MTATALLPGRVSALEKIGTPVATDSAAEALQRGGLAGWDVRKVKALASTKQRLVIPNKYALVRKHPVTGDDEVMSVVGKNYHITQNEEHIEFLQALADVSGGRFTTCASLKDGKLVYIQMKLPQEITVAGKDPVNLFLTGINSFDGTTPFMVGLFPVRAWCANQLPYFRSQTSTYRIRHTVAISNKVAVAREALGLVLAAADDFQAEAHRMIETEITRRQFEGLMDQLFPRPTVREGMWTDTRHMLRSIYDGPTNENITGTAWGAYNTVTEYVDHYQRTKRAPEAEEMWRAERAVRDHDTLALKARAFDLAAAL